MSPQEPEFMSNPDANNKFTVPEFIELLVCAVLAGLLAGGLVAYICLRRGNCRRQRRHGVGRPPGRQGEVEKSPVLDIGVLPRQRVSIPIQDPPPPGECLSPLTRDMTFSSRAEASTSHDSRYHNSDCQDIPTTPYVSSIPDTVPDSWSVPVQGPPPLPQPDRSTSLGNSSWGKMGVEDNRNDGSTAEVPLSRATTTSQVSTLPPYDTLSSGPPRYPTSSERSYLTNSPPLEADQYIDSTYSLPPLPRKL